MRKVLLSLIALLACTMAFTFGRRDPVESFWVWFREHEPALLALRTGHEPIADDLSRELHRIDEHLTWEFGPPESGPREFIVSADGIRESFPAVERVAAAAPALPRWTIIKFRPRRPDVTEVHVGDAELDAGTIRFHAERDGTLIALVIAVPGYRATPAKSFEQGAFLLLDSMLGEYTVETRIGGIDIIALDAAKHATWQPLTTVGATVDAMGGT